MVKHGGNFFFNPKCTVFPLWLLGILRWVWSDSRVRIMFIFSQLSEYVLRVLLLFVHRHSFTEDHYVEFSKHSQDRVIGTKGDIAHVST